VCLPTRAYPQLSTKEILAKNRNAIVGIFISGKFSGTGFVISEDGLIATANHVVAIQSSSYSEYAADITVKLPGRDSLYTAEPLKPITPESRNFDIAIIKIRRTNLPVVAMGSLAEVQEADSITLITAMLQSFVAKADALVVNGIISAKSNSLPNELGPGNVNIVIFQAPVRGGVSGSPVFSNKTGHVIGIVTTKVFGINSELENIRTNIGPKSGEISAGPVPILGTLASLIDTLNDGLISGLGSAVDISYAKQLIAEAKKNSIPK
jgi:hypothetical protein